MLYEELTHPVVSKAILPPSLELSSSRDVHKQLKQHQEQVMELAKQQSVNVTIDAPTFRQILGQFETDVVHQFHRFTSWEKARCINAPSLGKVRPQDDIETLASIWRASPSVQARPARRAKSAPATSLRPWASVPRSRRARSASAWDRQRRKTIFEHSWKPGGRSPEPPRSQRRISAEELN